MAGRVTQEILEVLFLETAVAARTTQVILEALFADTTQSGGSASAGPTTMTSFGYAS